MKLSEAKQCIKEIYLNTENVSALISERGVGKTSAYRQCAGELGIDYISLYAAALEGPDFMGLPDKDREKGITRYLAPQLLPTVNAVDEGLFGPRGILVFEEINRVPADTISVLYPLLLERRINGHMLAPGWKIGVTMNPDTMNYSVNSLDDAMLDRFIAIEITANLDDYMDYSLANNPNDDVLGFLQSNPDMLLVTRESADATALSKAPTPRGWTRVQELLNNCSLSDKLMRELIAGIVGPEAAASFFGYIEDRKFRVPDIRALLDDFGGVKPVILDILERKRLDIINLLIKKAAVGFELKEEHIRSLDAFIECLPDEMGVLFFKQLAAKRPGDFNEVADNFNSYKRVSDKIIEMMTV